MTLREFLKACLEQDMDLDESIVFDPGEPTELEQATRGNDDGAEVEEGVILPPGPIQIGSVALNEQGEIVLKAKED